MNSALRKEFGDKIPEFLMSRNKLLEDHYTDQFINDRRLLLEDWLLRTCAVEGANTHPRLLQFLELKASNVFVPKSTGTFGVAEEDDGKHEIDDGSGLIKSASAAVSGKSSSSGGGGSKPGALSKSSSAIVASSSSKAAASSGGVNNKVKVTGKTWDRIGNDDL